MYIVNYEVSMRENLIALKEIIENMEVNEGCEPGFTLFRLNNEQALKFSAILISLFETIESVSTYMDEEDNPSIH